MRGTPLTLLGIGLLFTALLAFLLADTSAEATKATISQCADWWCAPSNRFPVGAGILCGGLGILCVGIGLSGSDPPPHLPPHPEVGRTRAARAGASWRGRSRG